MDFRYSKINYFIIFFVSFSVLALEITYTRIFIVLTYSHFTSMIIGVALLGFGAAGSYLTINLKRATEHNPSYFISRNLCYFTIANLFVFYLIIKMRFFSLSWESDWTNQVVLLMFFLFLAIPFYFGGLIISYLFSVFPEKSNKLYFFDLAGAGLGSISIVLAFNYFSAPEIVHLISLFLTLLLLFMRSKSKSMLAGKLLLILVVGLLTLKIHTSSLMYVYPPPSKAMFDVASPWKGKDLIEDSIWHIIERVDVTQNINRNVWDFGGDISSRFVNEKINLRYVYKNGIMSTGILKVDQDISNYKFLDGYLQAVPYKIKKYNSAVSIGIGGGIDLWIALYNGVKHVIGVELNPVKVNLLQKKYKKYSGYLDDKSILVSQEGRNFLSHYKQKVDVIQMSGLDSYSALSSGAYAMNETYVFTVESFKDMLNHLNEDGVISITRIFFTPPRETLRLVSTMLKTLTDLNIKNPERHFLIVRGNRWTNTLLKKDPFSPEEVNRVLKWVEEMRYHVIYNPFQALENEFNTLINLPVPERKDFFDNYPYKIEPATDESPFFFQYYKWKNLFSFEESEWIYARHVPLGLKLVIFSLVQITLLGIVFIGIPLLKLKFPLKDKYTIMSMFYFAGLGVGFIMIEIVLIQRLNVFLGGPIYALSVTLFALLIFSGVGSYLFQKFKMAESSIRYVLILIIVLGVFYLFFLGDIMENFLGFQHHWRILFAVLLLAPISFLMGMPFPVGIRVLGKRTKELIPWAWGINSIFTVFGSVFCLFVSLSGGFKAAWIIALLAYMTAFLMISSTLSRRKA